MNFKFTPEDFLADWSNVTMATHAAISANQKLKEWLDKSPTAYKVSELIGWYDYEDKNNLSGLEIKKAKIVCVEDMK